MNGPPLTAFAAPEGARSALRAAGRALIAPSPHAIAGERSVIMPNRLANETSPYLLQHAGNPVDWHPWDDEALALARREGRPILLSIGYSACHWCHVMAHESFEDPRVAAAMNRISSTSRSTGKSVPDLDQIYQTAHALLTRRSGGWPLTMFLTPDGAPFFGGTYFPKEGRYGLPGFLELLPRVAAAYRERGADIAEQAAQLKDALASLEPAPGGFDGLPFSAVPAALAELKRRFDPEHGGFGVAPKFPHAPDLEFCLREHARNGDAEALAVVRVTLERMADGGIHDQLGGGFCRYSVDGEWTIPHFEKMLYDNGPLLGLYADLARLTGDPRGGDVARGIVGWMTREMRAGDGAFFSSLDADSEGEEGKFYVWSRDEVRSLLAPDLYAVAAPHYALDGAPNFEGHAWNLRVGVPLPEVAARLSLPFAEALARLGRAKATLFAARATRVRPGLDDKILSSWNALAIAGLARAARALDEPGWTDLAVAATDALRRTAWRDGRLLATRKGERAHLNAYLDDYAFLLCALLEVLQARFRAEDYAWARELADVLLDEFEDPGTAVFFSRATTTSGCSTGTKPGHDNATPSGNGMAAGALIAFGHLCARAALRRGGRTRRAAVRAGVGAIARRLRVGSGGARRVAGAAAHRCCWPATARSRGVAAGLEARLRPTVRIFNVAGVALPGPAPRSAPRGGGGRVGLPRHPLPAPVDDLAQLEAQVAA